MNRAHTSPWVVLGAALIIAPFGTPAPAGAQSSLSPGYGAADARYTPSERAGREIWFFATAFNDRFFTYSYPQRLGGQEFVARWSNGTGTAASSPRGGPWRIAGTRWIASPPRTTPVRPSGDVEGHPRETLGVARHRTAAAPEGKPYGMPPELNILDNKSIFGRARTPVLETATHAANAGGIVSPRSHAAGSPS